MTMIDFNDEGFTVRLSRSEKFLGLSSDVWVPFTAVGGVDVVDDALRGTRGMRAPGTALPGLKIGTWRGRHGKTFVSVRRGQQAVRVALTGQPYDELLIGVADAAAVCERLERARR